MQRENLGRIKKVKGDITKVKYARELTAAARRILQNLEHVTRNIPGTMEVRRLMRYDTHAGRIRSRREAQRVVLAAHAKQAE